VNPIAFIDAEIEPKSGKIMDLGAVKEDGGQFHGTSNDEFMAFLQGIQFVCGHNIFNHDLKYIGTTVKSAGVRAAIDTLYWSPLLFPTKPYHALVKDDKLQTDDLNNPLNDSLKARDLFHAEVAAFQQLDEQRKGIFYALLFNKREFGSLFRFIGYTGSNRPVEEVIHTLFNGAICSNAALSKWISNSPIELAYALAIIDSFVRHHEIHSITPPWVIRNYPQVEQIMLQLRGKPCTAGCTYCHRRHDIHVALRQYFKFDAFRTYGDQPLQENAVKAAVDNKSLLAVFPTGGGKSVTFQLPALMSGESVRGLTVVISPLQSLMKDQVDNLERAEITDAVTINGLLDPIERSRSIERVEDGSASILYISPESLRSKTIERALLARNVVRFVIDEAHCFSAWGQDFRVDYLYIGDFIKSMQEKKSPDTKIPVSCFTATAKPNVIEDIRSYFRQKLGIELELFTSKSPRTNLTYQVLQKNDEESKYQTTRDLINANPCPTIVYVSRTKRAKQLAERLTQDGIKALPYHGKMDSKEKTANQDSFISDEVSTMVATSAFGMGVDKKDVGMVIHYDISDSLENYVQEAGRAGRDEKTRANCYVLFNEEDLSKHFILLNQTKLSIKEIQQIWKAIKEITRFRATASNSALEIARKAGWDDSVVEIETRVTSAIAALEDAGYLKRGQNMPRIFANSIQARTAQEAIDKINTSQRFGPKEKETGIRIIKKLISSRARKSANDDPGESRIDYISDHLGIVKEEVIHVINLLREEGILADAKDLTAFIKAGDSGKQPLKLLEAFGKIEQFLLRSFDESERVFHIKELNQEAENEGCQVNPQRLKTLLNFWAIKHWIKRSSSKKSPSHIAIICLQPREALKTRLETRHNLARFILKHLHEKSTGGSGEGTETNHGVHIEFSVHELKSEFEKASSLFQSKVTIAEIEDALFYLSRIEALSIEGGFLVVYNQLTVERIEDKKRYNAEDYRKLDQYYNHKVHQIHIVGEYAQKMLTDYKNALQFVDDYFQLNYSSFLNKYFKGSRQDELKKTLTATKFKQLFGELSPTQLKVINDKESRIIVVAAGPGSGKTRILVHKLASLLLMEDVKHEQLLMLTFSRAATTEFKKRLHGLIGNASHYVEMKTFHSYAFDLLGRVGSLKESDQVVKLAIERIDNNEVDASRITKAVLVVDEAQDMHADEYWLIKALIERNEEMRVIAVGDDDQNIYEFRGSSSRYLKELLTSPGAIKYDLIENYRSKSNLVEFSNQYVSSLRDRLKSVPIIAKDTNNGKINITRYTHGNLIQSLVADILKAELSGSTCVLTTTNEQALQVVSLLAKNDMPTRLIQSNEGFNLFNLVEIRYFINLTERDDSVAIIDDETWAYAQRALSARFRRSSNLEVCLSIIGTFESIQTKKRYKSDLRAYIMESKLEDFVTANGQTVLVSTIHKAKGKEFDNVFLLLEDFKPITDEARRQLYVAMTRAKAQLNIHVNSDLFKKLSVDNLSRREDQTVHMPLHELILHTALTDVHLDYFITKQSIIEDLVSGDELDVDATGCYTKKALSVLRYSSAFKEKLSALTAKGYAINRARVNFVVYWLKEGAEKEILVVLPEIGLKRIVEPQDG
jgi:ATP-dependent DNA helicase RecQ